MDSQLKEYCSCPAAMLRDIGKYNTAQGQTHDSNSINLAKDALATGGDTTKVRVSIGDRRMFLSKTRYCRLGLWHKEGHPYQ